MHFEILNGNYRLQFYNVKFIMHSIFNVQGMYYKQYICPFVHPSIKITTKFANYSSEFYAFTHKAQNVSNTFYGIWNIDHFHKFKISKTI